ncbi:DUF805 domain-containing protein [Devosia sediminis]|uniref:DUF805 domain-containing protein n=1 Tax=Devosia sediminis TaxID=2798801 RepID=A0A934ML09_9HYPH|nr:DUF805 domain-containing protein [Devosia sediminis]MBJ3784665.1 DUF805 domain-containing protein [Devosia sediminis]
MDKLVSLLTTTEGRIGRQQWWIGIVSLIVIALVANIVFGIISFGNVVVVAWLNVLLSVVFLWPGYCIGIKRRRDRNNDGTDLKIFLAISVVLNLLSATGIGVTWTDMGGVMMPVPAMWLSLLNLAFGIFAIYMLVQLGFLKGTTGTNTYGADPLNAAA